MAKQYGLIIPGMQKKASVRAPARETLRPSIFSEDSSNASDDENGPPKMKKTIPIAQPSALERRMASRMQKKALEEDATVFQYDEVYDEIESKREQEIELKKNEPKKAKYIERLMVYADRRKLENELRIERQVQKEREEEGEEFKDKEKFVTTAYRKKLEEMRKLVEREKQEDYLEAIGDVTKQADLNGFYRHLYEQKLGTSKSVVKPTFDIEDSENPVNYKPIQSGKNQKQRSYRKRCTEEEDETEPQNKNQKVHLENNIDADSDFSIDSSSSDDEETAGTLEQKGINIKEKSPNITNLIDIDEKKITLNLQSLKSETDVEESKVSIENNETTATTVVIKPKPNIWKKRTVGEVFEAALLRYYERKAARQG